MNKNLIIGIAIVVILVIALGAWYFISQNNGGSENQASSQNRNDSVSVADDSQTNNNSTNETTGNNENSSGDLGRVLVVYYSAQNHTEAVAQQIAENLNADIFEIQPVDEYSNADLNWTDDNSRVSREYADESLRNVELVSTTVENWDDYDTVLIGYPIWWGIAAWPVDTFVKANDFNGKTVIPFCTSSSSGLGRSGELLAEEANGGNWLEGHRFRSNPSNSDIQNWTDSL